MTTREFKAAFAIASSNAVLEEELLNPFDGCAIYPFPKLTVTLRHVAKIIRYQAQYMNGGWDAEALEDVRFLGRKNWTVVG